MDYGIYTTQGKKTLLGNRATVNGRDAIAYVKNGQLQSYAYMDDFAFNWRKMAYIGEKTHCIVCRPVL